MYNRELASLYREYVEVLIADALSYQDASLSNLKDRTDRMTELGNALEKIDADLPERAEKFANKILERIRSQE